MGIWCCNPHTQHIVRFASRSWLDSNRIWKYRKGAAASSPAQNGPEHAASRSAMSEGDGWRIRGSVQGDPEHNEGLLHLVLQPGLWKCSAGPQTGFLSPRSSPPHSETVSLHLYQFDSESARSFLICVLQIFTLTTFNQFKYFALAIRTLIIWGYEEANLFWNM